MPKEKATIRQVKLQDGRVVQFDQQLTLLEALEEARIEVHFQCREGFCGACRAKLLNGQVCYKNQPLAFVRKGEILPCCCQPVSDIELDLD